LLDLKNIKNKS